MKIRKRFLFFAVGATGLFLFLVGAAISFIEPPQKMQLRKQDARRVQDLVVITRFLEDWYIKNGPLPEKIHDIRSRSTGKIVMNDPVSGLAYRYKQLSKHNFEICAIFETSNIGFGRQIRLYIAGRSIDFSHDVGQGCYTIDMKKINTD